jgi:tRNA-binding EMAP/Myf-like protein
VKKLMTLLLIVIIAIAILPAAGKTETKVPTSGAKSVYEGTELVVATWGWTAANIKVLSAALLNSTMHRFISTAMIISRDLSIIFLV